MHQIRAGRTELTSPSPRTPRSWLFEPRADHTHILVPGAAFGSSTFLSVFASFIDDMSEGVAIYLAMM